MEFVRASKVEVTVDLIRAELCARRLDLDEADPAGFAPLNDDRSVGD